MYTGWVGGIVCLLLDNCDIMAACCGCGIAAKNVTRSIKLNNKKTLLEIKYSLPII